MLRQRNESVARSRRRSVVGELVLVGISDHQADARQRRQFLGSALRVAAGHQDSRFGIFAMNAADGGTRVLIGGGGYGAGVQDNDFGFDGSGGALHAAIEQLALDGCAIRLGRAASEVLHMISRHEVIILSTNAWLPCLMQNRAQRATEAQYESGITTGRRRLYARESPLELPMKRRILAG